MLTFQDLQTEVARRATKDQNNSQFTTAVQVAINASLFRIAREMPWRVLRRTGSFNTVTSYSSYVFTATGVTVAPSVGDQYSSNGYVYTFKTVTTVGSTSTIYAISSASQGLLQNGSTGQFIRVTGAGDTTLNISNTTGPAITVSNSTSVTITNGTLITDAVKTGRKIKFASSGTYYFVKQINSNSTITLDQPYNGLGSTSDTYEILPQEEYVLPPQCSHRMFMWHEGYGYPYKMNFVTDQDFFRTGLYLTIKYIPTHYRMWGENDVISQPLQPGNISFVSNNSADTAVAVTIFGTVNGYPDSETVKLNGINQVTSTKVYSYVERVDRGNPSLGLITATSDTNQNTIAVIPAGDTTAGILYAKVQLYPLPTLAFPMHVWYYKDPYRLVNPGDCHELGQDFDEAIILLAVSKIKGESNLTEGATFYQLWQDEMKSLKKHNCDKMDFFPILRRPDQGPGDMFLTASLKYSQFGGQFGPSSRQ